MPASSSRVPVSFWRSFPLNVMRSDATPSARTLTATVRRLTKPLLAKVTPAAADDPFLSLFLVAEMGVVVMPPAATTAPMATVGWPAESLPIV